MEAADTAGRGQSNAERKKYVCGSGEKGTRPACEGHKGLLDQGVMSELNSLQRELPLTHTEHQTEPQKSQGLGLVCKRLNQTDPRVNTK